MSLRVHFLPIAPLARIACGTAVDAPRRFTRFPSDVTCSACRQFLRDWKPPLRVKGRFEEWGAFVHRELAHLERAAEERREVRHEWVVALTQVDLEGT